MTPPLRILTTTGWWFASGNSATAIRELSDEVERAARGLLALGIQERRPGRNLGDKLRAMGDGTVCHTEDRRNSGQCQSLEPLFELEYALRQSECQTLLLIQGFRDTDYVQVVREVCPESEQAQFGELHSAKLPELRRLIFMGTSSAGQADQASAEVPRGMLGWNDLLEWATGLTWGNCASAKPASTSTTLSTFSTPPALPGCPKVATLSHHNIVNNGMLIANAMRFTQRDRLCIPVPFYHCFGMVLANMACVVTGATMVIPATYFDAEATLRAVAEERCTALHGVPTMFIAELEHPVFAEFDLSSLRTGIMAGSPCPIEIMKRVVKQMHCSEMTIAYGLTEASPVITQTTPDDPH